LVFSLSVKEDSNNGQGANTFGTSTDLDRLLSLFPSKSTKIKKPTKSRTLAMGFGFLMHNLISILFYKPRTVTKTITMTWI
ncbi:hypothetical protein QTO16_24825, partial [Vibrio harveyi]|uniref:hypothetical protein n=1 Tax=Vibrio harveyi TaxID=669 RepID=UPI002F3FF005